MSVLMEAPLNVRYKSVGVGRLGKTSIPSHWSVKRFRNIFSFCKGLGITKEDLLDEGIPCVNYGEIHSKYGFDVNPDRDHLQCVSLDYLRKAQKSLLAFGDFVFADTSEDLEGSGNFTYLNSSEKVFAGYHTVIARPVVEAKHRFLAYLFDSLAYRAQIRINVKGVKVYSITNKILKDTLVFLPPLSEQSCIVNFLDSKTSKIDQAIEIKEQQIDLLKERKQILIQNAVIRGLNPNAPMKDSSVDWIGQIPAHWDVKRAKYLFHEVDERSKDGNEELLSVSHMTGVTRRSEKNVNMFMAEDYTGSKTCQRNDLVFNIMWAWMGALGVAPLAGIVSSSYGVFRQLITSSFNPKYLEWLLKTTSYIEHYNKVSTGLHSSRLRFYAHMFLNMEMGYPDKKEQDEIVDFIEGEVSKIEKALTVQRQQIDKLKEFRATIINSAVTGKIKVA